MESQAPQHAAPSFVCYEAELKNFYAVHFKERGTGQDMPFLEVGNASMYIFHESVSATATIMSQNDTCDQKMFVEPLQAGVDQSTIYFTF